MPNIGVFGTVPGDDGFWDQKIVTDFESKEKECMDQCDSQFCA